MERNLDLGSSDASSTNMSTSELSQCQRGGGDEGMEEPVHRASQDKCWFVGGLYKSAQVRTLPAPNPLANPRSSQVVFNIISEQEHLRDR